MSNKVLKWLILVALVLFIVSILSLWFGKPSFSDSKVGFTLTGPNQASAGDEVVYKLSYNNGTDTALSGLSFSFDYPDGAVVLDDNGNISNNTSQSFTVDSLPSGAAGEKEFHMFLVGDRGDIKTAKAKLSFNAGSLTSSFEKSAEISTTIINVPVSLTLVAPPNSVSGQNISYIFDYRNESDSDISDLRFVFNYPDGFTPTSFSPSPNIGNNTWSKSTLNKSEGSRITIQGILTGKEGDTKPVSVILKRKIGDQYINYEQAISTTSLANPLLNVSVSVNGSTNYSAHLGDELDYTIKYSNNSNFNLSGINLTAVLDGDMLDLSSLDTQGGYFDSSNDTITWNSSTVSNFNTMRPNTSGQLTFKVKVKQSFSTGGGSKNLIKVSTTIFTPNVPSGISSDQISADDSIITKVTTQPTFQETAYYNDSAFGSSGPLPLVVSKETAITIHWQVTNPGNDMTQAQITATLPTGINWKNVVSVGSNQTEPSFNKNTSQVTWDIGTLPAGVGVTIPKYEAVFQISVVPSSTQSGQIVPLIKNAQLSGVDSLTKQNIIIPTQDITSNDLTDKPGQGTVQ